MSVHIRVCAVDGKTLTPSQRNELDAKRMAEKIARKQEESKVSDSKSSSSDNAEAQRRKAMAANKKTKADANAKKKKNR